MSTGTLVWTDANNESLNWHDVRIYAVAFDPVSSDVLFDLDHIYCWVWPPSGETTLRFRVSPATLVLQRAWNWDAGMSSYFGSMHIETVSYGLLPGQQDDPSYAAESENKWIIDIQEGGDFRVRCEGYSLHYRRAPVLKDRQTIDFEERGGFSFSKNVLIEDCRLCTEASCSSGHKRDVTPEEATGKHVHEPDGRVRIFEPHEMPN